MVIQSASHHCHGWEEKFPEMSQKGDEHLQDNPVPIFWDEEEWEW
ncbi:MAG: hypothetical protein WCP19_16330 [Chloroflexota bacterium]